MMQRYPVYKDSGVEWLGAVPEGWVVAPLKTTLLRNDGGVWGNEPDGENDTLVLRSTEQTEFGNWCIDDPAPRKISPYEFAACLLEEGDLLVTKSSGSSKHIGKTTLVDEKVAALRCCYSNFMQRLRAQPWVSSRLLWYFLNNELARNQFDLLSNNTTGLANLSAGLIGQVVLPLGTLPEQTAIAAFLDRETAKIDTLVAEQRRLIALLREKRQAVISHAATKGLNPNAHLKPSGIDWLGDVPEGWEVLKLSATFKATKGPRGQLLTKEFCGQFPGEFPVYSGQTDNHGVMGSIGDFDFDVGNIGVLFSTTVGAKAMTVSHIVGKFSLSQNCMIIAPTTDVVLPRFFFYHFQPLFAYFRDQIPEHMQASFRMGDLYQFKIAMPPKAEQSEIASKLDADNEKLDALVATAETAIALLKERRAALISAAVTGKIDVRHLSPQATEAA